MEIFYSTESTNNTQENCEWSNSLLKQWDKHSAYYTWIAEMIILLVTEGDPHIGQIMGLANSSH